MLFAVLVLNDRGRTTVERDAAHHPTIAVLPIKTPSSSTIDGYVADALHEDIIGDLGLIGNIIPIERRPMLQYRDKDLPPATIADELDADFLLATTLTKDASRIHVSTTLLDRGGRVVWSDSFEGDLSTPGRIAERVAQALHVRVTSIEQGRLKGRTHENEAAYQLFARARQLDYGNETQNEGAAELLKQALRLDPEFSAATAHLAEVYFSRTYWLGKSRAWADSGMALAGRAIELDADQPDAHAVQALLLLDKGRLEESAAAFDRVLLIRPSDGDALRALGYVRFLQGRMAEAADLWMRSRVSDPEASMTCRNLSVLYRTLGDRERSKRWNDLSARIYPGFHPDSTAPGILSRDGRHEEAVTIAEQDLRENPGSRTQRLAAARVNMAAGRFERARQHFEELGASTPDDWDYWGLTYRTSYAYVLAQTGHAEHARSLFGEVLADGRRLVANGDEHAGVRRELAAVHAARGDLDSAGVWLERAIDLGWRLEWWFPSPVLEQCRQDPRISRPLARMQSDIERQKQEVPAYDPEMLGAVP